MIARAVALVSFPLAPSSTSRPDPSSLQRLMVLFPELIQYSASVSKSMARPTKPTPQIIVSVIHDPATRVCCSTEKHRFPSPTGPFWLVNRTLRLPPSVLAMLMVSPSVQ